MARGISAPLVFGSLLQSFAPAYRLSPDSGPTCRQHALRTQARPAPVTTFGTDNRFIHGSLDDGKANLRTGGYWRAPRPTVTKAASAEVQNAAETWQRSERLRHVDVHVIEGEEDSRGEAAPQCYYGFSSYGQGPGAYWPHTDAAKVVSSRPPGWYACPRCRRGGHWEFDCPSEHPVGGDEDVFALFDVKQNSGQRLCSDMRSAQCWKVGKWQLEKELWAEHGKPPRTRCCQHCQATGHFTHDCHRVGTASSDVDARDTSCGLPLGVCPACRVARARQRQDAPEEQMLFVELAEDKPPAHPSFHRCSICGGKHFRCDCFARPAMRYPVPIRPATPLDGAGRGKLSEGATACSLLAPKKMFCEACGQEGHWRVACPTLQNRRQRGHAVQPRQKTVKKDATSQQFWDRLNQGMRSTTREGMASDASTQTRKEESDGSGIKKERQEAGRQRVGNWCPRHRCNKTDCGCTQGAPLSCS